MRYMCTVWELTQISTDLVCSSEFLIQVCWKLKMSFWLQLSSRVPRSLDLLVFFSKFQFLYVLRFFCLFVSLTWDHMWVKISNDINEGTHQIHSQEIMHTPMEGLYQSCSKNCEIANFGFLPMFFFSVLLTWESPENSLYYSCEKNSEIWNFGKFLGSFFGCVNMVVNGEL